MGLWNGYVKKRVTTMYKKHKWFSGLPSFRTFNQLRQICDLTDLFNILNLCQNANLAQCKLIGKSFEITYVSYTNRCAPLTMTSMRIYLFLLLTLTFNTVHSQIDFDSDTSKSMLFPDVIAKIENLDRDFDFQLRFWTHGGITVPDQKDLFAMTLKNGMWNCQYFKFAYRGKKGYRIIENKSNIENCDSIWNYFVKNDILVLPTMNLLKDRFFYLNANGDTAKIIVLDGLSYSFEFLQQNKYKRIEYQCPVSYSKAYTDIQELQYISDIIRLIYRTMGIRNDPC